MDDKEQPPGDADLKDLARRYLDLWERQVVGFADQVPPVTLGIVPPFPAATITQMMDAGVAAMSGMLAASARAFADAGGEKNHEGGRDGEKVSATTARTTAAQSASGSSGDDVADLARRVAILEKRLAALESGVGQAGRESRPRPRRRKSGSTDGGA